LKYSSAEPTEGGAAGQGEGAGLGLDDAAGVAGKGLQVRLAVLLEPEPADGVLDVELVLELPGDGLGAADQQEVIRHLVRVGGHAGGGAGAGEEGALGLLRVADPVAEVAGVLPGVALALAGGLGPAVLEQLFQGVLDGGVGVVGEDHAPAGRRQVLGVDALDGAEGLFGVALVAGLQFGEVRGVDGLAPREGGDRFCR
jgi:hypothetical protein